MKMKMKITLTGKMQMKRTQMTELFSEMGIKVQDNVVIGTNYLVTGESPGNRKILSAKVRGVSVITEEDFMRFLDDQFPEYFL